MGVAEFDLIARIRARAATRGDVILGIGDDAALLQPPAGMQLVVAMDTLNSGVHFPPETAAADIGWKALAVNLSDLAAMGAQPAWCTLSLSLPDADAGFVDGFVDGFLELAERHGVALVGGDTTRGPLSVCVTVHGFVEPGTALRRAGARAGDEIWISGTVGDAAAALAQWRAGRGADAALRSRLDRPIPRVALGRALRGIASSCIDVSDGLAADLGHICRRLALPFRYRRSGHNRDFEFAQIVFRFAPNRKDRFAERHKSHHSKPIHDFQLRWLLHEMVMSAED